MRFAELGTVYRRERSGVLHGLMRVRMITMDDAHIFCTADQVNDEILATVDLCTDVLRTFGFDEFKIELSVRDPDAPQNYAGEPEQWDAAEAALASALDTRGLDYNTVKGEAAFYGPKIDIKMTDAIGRTWQASTIQFDFNLPFRFDAKYVGADGAEHHVVMVHRAVLGSMERFMGILLEHYEGRFPVWLAPVQVVLINVGRETAAYAEQAGATLAGQGFRVQVDSGDDTVGAKIRKAELQKVPYMLIVGKKELSEETVSVRSKKRGDEGSMRLDDFVARLKSEVESRA
jgi:threonyl-tRNA synthetase